MIADTRQIIWRVCHTSDGHIHGWPLQNTLFLELKRTCKLPGLIVSPWNMVVMAADKCKEWKTKKVQKKKLSDWPTEFCLHKNV